MLSFKVCAKRGGNAEMGLIALILTIIIGNCLDKLQENLLPIGIAWRCPVTFGYAVYFNAYEIFEEEKRQQLFPFPRIGRSFWNYVDAKRGGLVPFPRTGRTDGKRQGLIPFPRIGRSADDAVDYYEDSENFLDDLIDDPYDLSPLPMYKRAKFTPRIGRRRKRSVHSDEGPRTETSSVTQGKNIPENGLRWPDELLGLPILQENPYYDGAKLQRQLMPYPRVGRGMFNPRVGKKNLDYHDDDLEKRAALIPRVGRADPRIRTRAAFQPRVGRALQPRVGRSKPLNNLTTKSD